MAQFQFQPSGDWLNDGWKIIGGVTALWQALTDLSDGKYIQAPASKSGAAVTFPMDTPNVPDGAIVTSVTVKMRVGLGAGTAPAGTAPSVTVAVAAQDNTSRYMTRTIFPTSTPTDYEIATYQRDALGLAWDVFRLNNLLCRIFSYVGVFDVIRVFRLWCDIKYRLRPTIAITAPTGTVTTPSPTITWQYSQADGDPQKTVEYKLFTAEQVAKVSFNPDTATPVFAQTLQGDLSSVLLPTSINSNAYWVYMRATSSFGARSVWVGRPFTVTGPSPAIPGVDDPNDALGSAVITVVPDSESGSASLHMRNTSNLLSAQEADAESPFDGHTFTVTNGTLVREPVVSFPGGTASWKLTATAAGTTSVTTDYIEIDGPLPMTARAQFRAATSGRSCRVVMRFYDDAYAEIAGSALTGGSVADSSGTWTEASVYDNSPTGAVYTRVTFEILSAAAGEVHNLDHLGVSYGLNTPWSDGSHASRNLLSAYISTSEGTQIGGEFWTPDAASTVVTAAAPATGTGASGSTCFKMTYNGLNPSIAYRGAGTAWTSPTTGADFTLNKPASAANTDLMLAFVTSSEFGTITPPSGWTLVNQARVDDGGTDMAMYVLKRTATASEPTSWTDGFLSVSSARRSAVVVAYAGASDVLTDTQAATGADTPLYLSTPTLNNTDPNGWRVSAFAVSDNAAPGTLTANRQNPSLLPSISYVGAATQWATAGTAGAYTINRPSGVQSGDVMIATVGFVGKGATVNVPSGWTLRSQATADNTSAGPYTLAVLYRVAGASEPASWSSSVTGGTLYRTMVTQCLAYRNVDTTTPFINSGMKTQLDTNSIVTGQATNTNSLGWRVAAFGGLTEAANSFGTTNEVVERVDNYISYSVLFGGRAGNTVAMHDSNGPVSTGTYERYAYSANSMYAGVGFLGILKPVGSTGSVPNETQRATTSIGSSNPYTALTVFDSAGITATGSQSMTGTWTPSSGTDKNSMAGWFGILKPAAAQTQGYATAMMNRTVDVSMVNTSEIPEADFVTVTAAFTGSAAGTPYLTVAFYRANVLLGTQIGEGTPFAVGAYTKSSATFEIPEGTTRMSVGVSVSDRQIGDIVYWDRVSLAYGIDDTYRPSTSRAEHPVWSKPQIQYADDDGTGYSEWRDLPGLKSNPPAFVPRSGAALYTDHTPIPLTNRKYRVRTVSLGLSGDLFVSDWGPDSPEFTYEAENYWLKDIANPDANLRLKVKWDMTSVAKTNSATVFQPLGADLPVVLSEGYKGDTFTLKLTPVNHEERAELRKMLTSGRTLFLQSDIDDAWWVRPIGDLVEDVLPTNNRQSNPLREITCQFVQVEPAE